MHALWPSGTAGIVNTSQFSWTCQFLRDALLAATFISFNQSNPTVLWPEPKTKQRNGQDNHAMNSIGGGGGAGGEGLNQVNPNWFRVYINLPGPLSGVTWLLTDQWKDSPQFLSENHRIKGAEGIHHGNETAQAELFWLWKEIFPKCHLIEQHRECSLGSSSTLPYVPLMF